MVFEKAQKKKAKLRLGIAGPSGSGKSYSALLIARGLTDSWEKIVVIDTENNSADLYADLGEYSVFTLSAPYKPEKYIQAIREAEKTGFEVIIIDSLSHAWAGEGGLLDIHGKLTDSGKANSFSAWRAVTPMHNALVEAISSCKGHIICNLRSKTEYLQQSNEKGKTEIKRVGLAPVFREGFEYEMTVFLELSHDHHANVTKDRTGLLDGQLFRPTTETGEKLLKWLEKGVEPKRSQVNQQEENVYYLVNSERKITKQGKEIIRLHFQGSEGLLTAWAADEKEKEISTFPIGTPMRLELVKHNNAWLIQSYQVINESVA